MKDKNLKGFLQQSLGEEVQPKRLEETIKLCTKIVREQEVTRAEPRTGFFPYLSDVFRFEGIPIFGLQAVTLFIVCLTIASIADVQRIYQFLCLCLYWLSCQQFLKASIME